MFHLQPVLASADTITLKCASDGQSKRGSVSTPGPRLPAPSHGSPRHEKGFSVCFKARRRKWEKQASLCSNGDLQPAQEAG